MTQIMWPLESGDYVGVDIKDDIIVWMLSLTHLVHLMKASRLF